MITAKNPPSSKPNSLALIYFLSLSGSKSLDSHFGGIGRFDFDGSIPVRISGHLTAVRREDFTREMIVTDANAKGIPPSGGSGNASNPVAAPVAADNTFIALSDFSDA